MSFTSPRWYQEAVIYQLHVKSYSDSNGDGIGDFRGLTSKLDYLQELGVTALWLLPFYPSPLRDDGYDTADYVGIHPSYGSMADFKEFLAEAKRRNLRIITELVLNHTSDQHAWFQRARKALPGSTERNFYVWSDTPDKYQDARIIFKDFEASNWTWDSEANAYYWHRFYSHQPDLNWDNPDVAKALYEVVDFWFELGIDGLRLDAVPYLIEREGTNCENLPETHQVLKDLRAHIDKHHKDKMLIAEANMWPDEVAAYFGEGNECHMAFHFPLMPRLYMSMQMEDSFPIIDILDDMPDIPEGTQWAIFLRNHDELTLEMVTDEERDYMWRIYAKDERARINLGIRRRLAPLLGNSRRQIELINSLLFSMPGTPIVYYGDELGMGDNIYLGDRDGVRTPMQWSSDRNAGFSIANSQQLFLPVVTDPEYHSSTVNVEAQLSNHESLLWWTRRMIALRKNHPALGHGKLEWIQSDNTKVLSYLRSTEYEQILCVANLSRHAQFVELDLSHHIGAKLISIPGRSDFPSILESPYGISLGPHDFMWFIVKPAPESDTSLVMSGKIPEITVKDNNWQSILSTSSRYALEKALPPYLATRRWFRSKSKRIRDTQITKVIPIEDAGFITLIDVNFFEGEPERYVLPLCAEKYDTQHAPGISAEMAASIAVVVTTDDQKHSICDGCSSIELCNILLKIVLENRSITSQNETISGISFTDTNNYLPTSSTSVSLVDGAHSNTTIEFDDQYVLKIYRRLEPGQNIDVEIAQFLTEETNCKLGPEMIGELRHTNSNSTLASLQVKIPHRGDAWTIALDSLRRFAESAMTRQDVPELPAPLVFERAKLEPTQLAHEMLGDMLEAARLIGVRTAELHMSLASAPPEQVSMAPEAVTPMYRRSLYQSLRSSTKKTFSLLRKLKTSYPDLERVINLEEVAIDRLNPLLNTSLDHVRIRCHGDYHLGQILWEGSDIRVLDFEGEPLKSAGERRIKRSALRDVASMVRSFDYAACSVYEDITGTDAEIAEPIAKERLAVWFEYWYRWVSATFVRTYLDAVGPGALIGIDTQDSETLLDSLLTEKALYELVYEANSRPDWTWIPLRSILRRLTGNVDGAR